jgi:hypothetical protein
MQHNLNKAMFSFVFTLRSFLTWHLEYLLLLYSRSKLGQIANGSMPIYLGRAKEMYGELKSGLDLAKVIYNRII